MSKKPSKRVNDVQQALERLLINMQRSDAEFPDVAWHVASSWNVDYQSLVDAYDDYCANK